MALLSLGLTALILAVQSPDPPAPAAGPVAGPPVAAGASAPEVATAAALGSVPPVGLRIPAIDVTARTVGLGLNADQTVEVPSRPMDSGWYEHGPRPGERGSAVVLGHVDSPAGPAVFARLSQLGPGDLVHVEGADGSTSTFRVERVRTYPNEEFPAREVYAGPRRASTLNLVTCGGEYDAESGYQANVVVYTRLVPGA